MRWTVRRPLHSGQLEITSAEGGALGSAMVSVMGSGHLQTTSSRRPFRWRLNRRVSFELESVDLDFRIRDGGIGIGPCEADFERRKRHAVDDDRRQIRPPDPGVPQTPSGLEGFNSKAVIVALHFGDSPAIPESKQNMSP
jgi:hypothetical protein